MDALRYLVYSLDAPREDDGAEESYTVYVP
jgi:hypothetical protein